MEKMEITIVSLVADQGGVRARARVIADRANISVQVQFEAKPGTSRAELWGRAKDQVLWYLDPA